MKKTLKIFFLSFVVVLSLVSIIEVRTIFGIADKLPIQNGKVYYVRQGIFI